VKYHTYTLLRDYKTNATAGVKKIDFDSAKAFGAYLCIPTNDQ
jgi:hypothetical protein